MAVAAVVRQVRAEVGERAAGSRQCVADDEVVCHICEEPASGCVLCVCPCMASSPVNRTDLSLVIREGCCSRWGHEYSEQCH